MSEPATVHVHVDCNEIAITFGNSHGTTGALFTYHADGGPTVDVALRPGESEGVQFSPDARVTVWSDGVVVAIAEPAACEPKSAPVVPLPVVDIGSALAPPIVALLPETS